jgi:hypothetical protein
MTELEEREFLHCHSEFYTALCSGVVCGLNTINETVFNWDFHGMALFPHKIVSSKILELYDGKEAWLTCGGSEEIPKWLIDEENKRLEEYFDNEKKVLDLFS